MQDKHSNVKVIRSVWRRTKKGYVKVRDLQAEKDVKGGSRSVAAVTKSSWIAETTPLTPSEPRRDRWLRQSKSARDHTIRKLSEMPTERERKQRMKRIRRALQNFLWLIKRR